MTKFPKVGQVPKNGQKDEFMSFCPKSSSNQKISAHYNIWLSPMGYDPLHDIWPIWPRLI